MWWNKLAAALRNAGTVLTPIGVFFGAYQLRVCVLCILQEHNRIVLFFLRCCSFSPCFPRRPSVRDAERGVGKTLMPCTHARVMHFLLSLPLSLPFLFLPSLFFSFPVSFFPSLPCS